MSKFVHHADLTCYAQQGSFNAGHKQIERYTFPFSGAPDKIKESVKLAIAEALEARDRRGGLKVGRLHVELDEENPGSGRVVDHLPRFEQGDQQQEKPLPPGKPAK